MRPANPLPRFRRAGIFALFGAVLALAACGKSAAPPAPATSPTQQADAMAHQHAGDAPNATPAVLTAPAVPVAGQEVTYGTLEGHPLKGYFVKPKDSTGPLPGVIVFHEWWGLNDNIRAMADRLAGEGYAVLAADLYGGQTATTPDAAHALMEAALKKMPAADRNIDAAYAYLKGAAKAGKIGTLGWCFGGSLSFEAGQELSGKLAATVIYYGFVNDKPEALAKLKAPVLAFFGGKDDGIPAATVDGFRKGLEAQGATPIVHVYPEAGHAFANPSGQNYRKDDADDAWRHTLDFLGETLKA